MVDWHILRRAARLSGVAIGGYINVLVSENQKPHERFEVDRKSQAVVDVGGNSRCLAAQRIALRVDYWVQYDSSRLTFVTSSFLRTMETH